MDLEIAIAGRRTIQEFSAAPVDGHLIERALTLAQWAPNHRTNWPWRFYWCGPQTRQQLAEIAVALKQLKAASPITPASAEKIREEIMRPAEVLAVTCLTDAKVEVFQENQLAVACAIQNLQLALWSLGLGCKWKTGAIISHVGALAALAVNAELESCIGLLFIGHPAVIPKALPRPALEQVLHKLP